MPVRKKAATKKATAKKSKPRAKEAEPAVRLYVDPVVIEQIVLLMIGGLSDALLHTAAVEKLKMTPEKAAAAINEARRVITIAADYNRHEQLGKAVKRIDALYSTSVKMQDAKTALACQRELNKLLSLYEPTAVIPPTKPTEENAEAKAIRLHLVPLGLASESAPLAEHCRIAALKLINHIEPKR